MATVAARATLSCSASAAVPFLDVGPDIVTERCNAGERQARDNGEHGRERHRANEAEERVAADRQCEQGSGHIAAAARFRDSLGADQNHGAEADNEHHEVGSKAALPWHPSRYKPASARAAWLRFRTSGQARVKLHPIVPT
jgi:hypothetical protein